MEEIKKLKIIVVDDEPNVLTNLIWVLDQELSSLDIEVTILPAINKNEALKLYKKNPTVDLMIVDIGINPKKNITYVDPYLGISLMEEIRRDNHNVLLIAYTLYSHDKIYNKLAKINASLIDKTGNDSTKNLISEILNLLEENYKWKI